jgi:hypothetical protein
VFQGGNYNNWDAGYIALREYLSKGHPPGGAGEVSPGQADRRALPVPRRMR